MRYIASENRRVDEAIVLAEAVDAYKIAGVLDTRHVQRRLKQYADNGPVYRTRLVAELSRPRQRV
jgi:hypothetical protein